MSVKPDSTSPTVIFKCKVGETLNFSLSHEHMNTHGFYGSAETLLFKDHLQWAVAVMRLVDHQIWSLDVKDGFVFW